MLKIISYQCSSVHNILITCTFVMMICTCNCIFRGYWSIPWIMFGKCLGSRWESQSYNRRWERGTYCKHLYVVCMWSPDFRVLQCELISGNALINVWTGLDKLMLLLYTICKTRPSLLTYSISWIIFRKATNLLCRKIQFHLY